jgi:hypothetical protein
MQESFKFFYFFNPCTVLDNVTPSSCTSQKGYFKNNRIANACRKGIDQLKKGELLSSDVIEELKDTAHFNEIKGASANRDDRKMQVPFQALPPAYAPSSGMGMGGRTATN